MRTFVHDLRHCARTLRTQPGFTLIAVLTLGLGIGANTAMFTVVDAVLVRALPYPQPERIMTVWETIPSEGVSRQGFAPGNYTELKAQQTVFAQMAGVFRSELTLTGDSEPEGLEGFTVLEREAFDILGVTPALGRLFLPAEYVRGSHRVLLISHRLWQRRFAAAPDAIGKAVTLNDERFVIVGVLPADFQFLNPDADFWAPIGVSPAFLAYRGSHSMRVLARLRPGVTQAQAQAEVTARMRLIARAHPSEADDLGAFVQPLHESLTGDARRPLLVLLGGVVVVLLIACANLANLLLARAMSRRKEIAVRVALGVGRGRLVQQLLTESLLLSVMGGTCGLLVTVWSLALLRQFIPPGLAPSASLGLDGSVLAYMLAVSALTSLLCGLVPAWQATRLDVVDVLKQSGMRAGLTHRRAHNALVIAEVAMALVLLIGAGLLMQTFYFLRHADVGFRADNVLTFQARLPRARYVDHAQRMAFFQQTLERMRLLPGVVSVAYASHPPMAGRGGVYALDIEGRPIQPASPAEAGHRQVSADYFKTLGIAIQEGRAFDERDTATSPSVAIINAAMARRYWPTASPIHQRFRLLDEGPGPLGPLLTIVGVAADVAQSGPETESRPEFYVPQAQVPYNPVSTPSYWIIRTAGDPLQLATAARRAVHAVDASLLVADVRTMDARLDQFVAPRRLRMTLLTAYAALALLLASVGLYGVLAHFVTQHTSEIGVRMALGAQAGDVLQLVLRRGMGLALLGVGIGLLAAAAVTRLMKTLLFGVSETDPITFGFIALLLLGVALVACWLPARRASRVDPLVALRRE